MKFVDPIIGIAFKKIFGNENKKNILISFLNSILDLWNTNKEIIEIEILNPYQAPKLDKLKETILDIRARDKRDITYIIEMQVYHSEAFEKRVLYYTSKAYYLQIERADKYPKLNQVVFIGFLNFIVFKENKQYFTNHLILEKNTGDHYLKDFEFNFIELPKFTKTIEEIEEENIKEKWIYFVKNASNLDMIPEKLKHPVEFQDAFDIANTMT